MAIKQDALVKLTKELSSVLEKPVTRGIKNRIAYIVSHGASYASNGYAVRTQGVAKALNEHGYETLCMVRPGRPWELDKDTTIGAEEIVDGVRYIHSGNDKDFIATKAEAHLKKSAEYFKELFYVYRPEFVIAASDFKIGLPALIAAKQLGIPFFNEVRGFWEMSRIAREPEYEGTNSYKRQIERDTFVAQQANAVFTLSETMRTELAKRGVDKQKVYLLPNGVSKLPVLNGVNTALKASLGIQPDEKVIGFIGSINAYEGLDTLIAACQQLIDHGNKIKLLLVGDSQPLNSVLGDKYTSNISSNLPWLIQVGRVPHEKVGDYYSLVDTIVIPRKKLRVCEVVPPLKIAEALSFNQRLVVSNLPPLLECTENYDDAQCFQAGDAIRLKETIEYTLTINPQYEKSELLFSSKIGTLVYELKKNNNSNFLVKYTDRSVEPSEQSFEYQNLPYSKTLNVNFETCFSGVRRTQWSRVKVKSTKAISVVIYPKKAITEKSVILIIRYLDKNGKEFAPKDRDSYLSKKHGYFRYLPEINNRKGLVTFNLSNDVESVVFSFLNINNEKVEIYKADIVKECRDKKLNTDLNIQHQKVFDFIHKNKIKNDKTLKSRVIIYGDISPNVLDGSSIWLTSITNIVSSNSPAILLLKDNIKNEKVVSNIKRLNQLTIIQPKDIGCIAPFDIYSATEALSLLNAHLPKLTALITRGVDFSFEISKRKDFTGMHYPYLTDFYEINDSGFSLVDEKVAKVKEIVLNARKVLYQTPDIKRKIEEILGYKADGFILPPSIPDEFIKFKNNNIANNKVINIGYAGKVQLRWGVIELIEEIERQIKKGRHIRLHIATGKIFGKGEIGSLFVQKVKQLLQQDYITLYDSLSREGAVELMSRMDLVWCYRDPILEDSTLELSTKLVETAALGKPCIAYRSNINKQFLGQDYPFLIDSLSDLTYLLESFESLKKESLESLNKLSYKISESYTFTALQRKLRDELEVVSDSPRVRKKIAVSGHDLKFIYSYISYLRTQGAEVCIDPWEWGRGVNLDISEYYSDWAEVILCEWGLANLVWHADNKKSGKKLIARLHAQEIRRKAAQFGYAVKADNVDSWIFVSPVILNKAIQMFGLDRKKVHYVPNWVGENRFFDSKSEVRTRLGMVGIVPTSKRFDRALDLVSALNSKGLKVDLYCKGHRPEDLPFMSAPGRKHELEYYQENYKRIDENPNLKGHVFFDEWGNDVEIWYRKISFILSPSDNESFHYALADGVMAGCIPIIWPWEGAEATYKKEWVIEDIEEAVEKVESFLLMSPADLRDYRIKARSFITDSYYEETVFLEFNKHIF
ncbi:glycosyltransferase [Salinimonas marina]|uniref:Glycosyltransferase n=1 Tax=Salinimonas marina TaxID=2785918 RepID=A0A7S9DYL7_9ALTE|nr:glycosyltransferase [Salinimonas marina]QPG06018.1 glycosyltransferase [Salinimonas marina]